jgi:hypothetical protein
MAAVGGCQCGDVRYEIAGDPLAPYICHRRECQKQSASAFGMSLEIKRADFYITRGEARSLKPCASGSLTVRRTGHVAPHQETVVIAFNRVRSSPLLQTFSKKPSRRRTRGRPGLPAIALIAASFWAVDR